MSWHEVVGALTVHTVLGAPGPEVRVTWYCAPASWLVGSVHCTVTAPPPSALADAVGGAVSVAATDWPPAALEASV